MPDPGGAGTRVSGAVALGGAEQPFRNERLFHAHGRAEVRGVLWSGRYPGEELLLRELLGRSALGARLGGEHDRAERRDDEKTQDQRKAAYRSSFDSYVLWHVSSSLLAKLFVVPLFPLGGFGFSVYLTKFCLRGFAGL